MKTALSLLIVTVMIVIGIYATGTAENAEADVLPEIAFRADDAATVLAMVTSTNYEFKIYELDLVTAENSTIESFRVLAVTDHQDSFDRYLSDLRNELVTESRIDNTIDDMEYVDIGNIKTAGVILRL